MEKYNIIANAIENLNSTHWVKADWDSIASKELDGTIVIFLEDQSLKLNFVARQEIRQHQLPQLEKMASDFAPFIVIAGRIFPKLKNELIQKRIAYLESNGNIYVKQGATLIWIDTPKSTPYKKEKNNRAFTKTGLKVLFHFLLNENRVNHSYREIASETKVGLGNINYVISGLKEMGFLIKLDKNHYKLINKKELLDKWMATYEERLKPALHLGTFRFLKEADFLNWKTLSLQKDKTVWGGEPAGDLLTNYLRPSTLSLYTTETRNELIKNYRLVPDINGNVSAYKKFWHDDAPLNNPSLKKEEQVVPPLLAYADLMSQSDSRCTQTAQMIYEQFIKPNL